MRLGVDSVCRYVINIQFNNLLNTYTFSVCISLPVLVLSFFSEIYFLFNVFTYLFIYTVRFHFLCYEFIKL